MEISIKKGNELHIESENVHIIEDVEERTYSKAGDGKIDYKNVKRDISTDILNQFVSVLEELIYHRKAEFDSSSLIERLFEKLPEDTIVSGCSQINLEKIKRYETALQQIASGEIVNESKNYKDALYICRDIAKNAFENKLG